MIYPTIEELTKGGFNRYELVIGVAKSARDFNANLSQEFPCRFS